MTPSRATFRNVMTLLGADTVTLAAALSVRLITTAFAESMDYVPLTADEATFDGYAGIDRVAATRPTSDDPATGNRVLTITPPLGGWRWESTGLTNLPQTINGYVVMLGAATIALTGGTMLACKRLDTAITITAADQAVLLPDPQLTLVVGGIR